MSRAANQCSELNLRSTETIGTMWTKPLCTHVNTISQMSKRNGECCFTHASARGLHSNSTLQPRDRTGNVLSKMLMVCLNEHWNIRMKMQKRGRSIAARLKKKPQKWSQGVSTPETSA